MLSPALSHLLQLLYFTAPAYAANMAPPFVRYWKGWNPPINRQWLGEHKTVIGFGIGLLAAVIVTFIQSRVVWSGALSADSPDETVDDPISRSHPHGTCLLT